MTLITRTPLHVGAGSSVGSIDLPVQRERHTQIPIIPGSSLKGVLRDLWNEKDPGERESLFGTETTAETASAGNLLVGEARVVCFPVRSARGSFAWLTSPLAIRRYLRDRGMKPVALPELSDDRVQAGTQVTSKQDSVILEEYCFSAEALNPGIEEIFKDFLPGDALCESLPGRLVLASDGIFSHFCANACEIQQRVRIDDETHVVAKGALFNQENVPSETLFYAVIGDRSSNGAMEKLEGGLKEVGNVLQLGGDETVGLGYCSVFLQANDNNQGGVE